MFQIFGNLDISKDLISYISDTLNFDKSICCNQRLLKIALMFIREYFRIMYMSDKNTPIYWKLKSKLIEMTIKDIVLKWIG